MLTLKAALEEAVDAIGRVDAHVLVANLLGVDRAYLIANPMRVLTETEDARIDMIVARRAMGHPVAHLLAEREFYGRMFSITPDVLIPRPETEILVEAALERIPSRPPDHLLPGVRGLLRVQLPRGLDLLLELQPARCLPRLSTLLRPVRSDPEQM